MSDKPRILVFTGDGKGKTTAALGIAFRASGHAMRTCVIQFIKNDVTVGEIAAAAANQYIEIHQAGMGFLPPADDIRLASHRDAARRGLDQAADAIASGQFNILILDELCSAVAKGLVDERDVLELLALAPADMCIVLTGRGASPQLVAAADTVTEMLAIKHGMTEGRSAEEGIER